MENFQAPFSAWKSRMQEMAEKHKEQMETWKKEHDEQMKQWAKEGPFGNLRGEDENVGKWDNLVEELKEKPMEEHEKWQEDAWTLLEEWLKDDSPSSSLNLEGWKSEVPMIHLSSRVTKGNSTEEKMGIVPVSTLVPLLRHLATSPLFLQTVPMLLPIIVPAALLFLLGPLLVVPIIMLVVGGTIMAGLSFFGSLLFPLGMGAVTHMASWLSRQVTIILDFQNCPLMKPLQDMHSLLERLAEEKVSIESESSTVDSILKSTDSPPLVMDETASTNTVVHSEVPRLLSW